MVKTKRKGILRTLLCAVFALCFAVGLSSLFASGTTAYAATTPKYTVKFNWSTTTTTGTVAEREVQLQAARQQVTLCRQGRIVLSFIR